jgi:hypothetical protein
MIKLFKNAIAFICLFCTLFVLTNLCIENNILNNSKFTSFKYKQNPTYLVLGNSRPHNALNDSIITGLVNISEVAESYYYSFLKLKTLIEHNKKLKIVFLEYDNNQILASSDDHIYGKKYLFQNLPIFSPFMTFGDKFQLFNLNSNDYIHAYSLAFRLNIINVVFNKTNLIDQFGGFFPNSGKRLDSLIKYAPFVNERKDYKKNEFNVASLNLIYLRKCIEICRNNNVRIVLIRSPIHVNAPMLGNDSSYNNILHTSFKDVDYIDFKNFIVPDSCYADFTHFNYYGADIFSKWFDQQLKSGLMSNKNLQQFVDSGINNNNNKFQ